MSRVKVRFTEAEIMRALKGAKKSGYASAEVKVQNDGSISIIARDLPIQPASEQRDADALFDEWERKHGRH